MKWGLEWKGSKENKWERDFMFDALKALFTIEDLDIDTRSMSERLGDVTAVGRLVDAGFYYQKTKGFKWTKYSTFMSSSY